MPAAAIAFAAARRSSTSADPGPGEIEPQDPDARTRQRARDVNSGATVFPAREAVGEDRPAPRRPFRRFEVPGQRRASPTDKRK